MEWWNGIDKGGRQSSGTRRGSPRCVQGVSILDSGVTLVVEVVFVFLQKNFSPCFALFAGVLTLFQPCFNLVLTLFQPCFNLVLTLFQPCLELDGRWWQSQ